MANHSTRIALAIHIITVALAVMLVISSTAAAATPSVTATTSIGSSATSSSFHNNNNHLPHTNLRTSYSAINSHSHYHTHSHSHSYSHSGSSSSESTTIVPTTKSQPQQSLSPLSSTTSASTSSTTLPSTTKSKSHFDLSLSSIPLGKISWNDFNDHPFNKPQKEQQVAAFYNLYFGRGSAYINIVHEQLDLLNITGLLSRLDKVYYVTIGKSYHVLDESLQSRLQFTVPFHESNNTANSATNTTATSTSSTHRHSSTHKRTFPSLFTNHSNNSRQFIHLHNSISPVDEALTLSYLYNFCHSHPSSIVLYFHNKGSYHFNAQNIYFRNFLDCYVLNTHCLDTLLFPNTTSTGFDTCGLRFSPIPNMHYSGNFWWAKCSYVNTLVHPASMILNTTFAAVTNALSHGIVSSQRYLPEAWIGSGPNIKPADCLDHDIDQGSFLCCYDHDRIAIHQCPNHIMHLFSNHNDKDSVNNVNKYDALSKKIRQRMNDLTKKSPTGTLSIGSTCKAAQVITNPSFYIDAYEKSRTFHEYKYRTNVVHEMKKRSLLWYGQEPTTYLFITDHLAIVNRSSLPKPRVILVEPNSKHMYLYENDTVYDSRSKAYQMTMRYCKEKGEDIPRIPMAEYKIQLLKEKHLS